MFPCCIDMMCGSDITGACSQPTGKLDEPWHRSSETDWPASLERIQSYLDIEKEEAPREGGKPPAAWPTSGDLRVENLVARYSADGPIVLNGVSFHIKSGDRVGVGKLPRGAVTEVNC
jgi:ABC-type bacteriocin/lantibiotic exporter with double-glycine peptidase domain